MSAWMILSPLAVFAGVLLGYRLGSPARVPVEALMVPPIANTAPPTESVTGDS